MGGSGEDRNRTGREEGGAVGLMVELFNTYNAEELTGEAPLVSKWGTEGWRVWDWEQATRCLRDEIARVGRNKRDEGRGAWAKLIVDEFALHSGRIGGVTGLPAKRVPDAVIRKEALWCRNGGRGVGGYGTGNRQPDA